MATSSRATKTDAATIDPEVEKIMVESLKAKTAAAKNKAKPLDTTRVMKMDVRDPRARAKQWPCWGRHTPSAPQANLHGQWIVCAVCNVRLLYTPRQGSSSQHTTVENPGMIKRMLGELQPLMGDVLPTAQICRHMLAKINAEEVLNKAITEARTKAYSTTAPPATTTSPTTTTSWEVAVPEDDEELVQAYETEAQGGYMQINYQNGFDLYQRDTWWRLRELRRAHRPRRMWLSLPSSKWCAWRSLDYDNSEKLEQGRRRERRLLWEVTTCLKESLEEDSELDIYFEWPHPCGGWKQAPMVDFQTYLERSGVPWLRCRIDGCNYGMRDNDTGMFIRKPWLVYTTDESFHHAFRAKVCPGNHGSHCRQEGHEQLATSYYPWKLVQAVARHWRDRTAPLRHARLLQQREGVTSTPVETGGIQWNHVLEERDEDHVFGEEEAYMETQMMEATRLGLETLCREARLRERFDMEVCENILLEFMNQTKQAYIEKKNHSRWQQSPVHTLLGAYSHGAFSGVTRNSLRYPELNYYINSYLRHWLPQQQWSSILLTLNGKTLPHTDNHNCKGTVNILHGMGSYQDGGLWLRGESPNGHSVVRRQLPDGSLCPGYVLPTRRRFVIFSPEVTHATQSSRGQRLVITAYTTRLTPQLTKDDWATLTKLGYPLPRHSDFPRDFVEVPEIKNSCSSTTTTPTKDPVIPSKEVKDHFPATTTTSTEDPVIPSEEVKVHFAATTATSTSDHGVSQDATGNSPEPSQAERARWEAQIAKFHKAAGHPTNRNLAKIVKDAGHPEWRVQAALQHSCPACQSLKPGGTSSGQIPPASTHSMYGAWEAVGVDSAEWVPPGGKTKVKFLLFMDLATKLRVTKPLYVYDFLEMRSESGDDFIRNFAEGWLGAFPKPKLLVMDAAKSFVSEAVHEFASHVNIQVSYVAEKEAWSHGVLESGVQDVKMTASAIHLENLTQDPAVTLILATSSLNATEYTGGFSSYQWAFGREYSLSDEDVRTFLTSDYQHEFVKLVQARSKAEEIARSTRAKRVLTFGARSGRNNSSKDPAEDTGSLEDLTGLAPAELSSMKYYHIKPVTETERFQFETSGEDQSSTWRTLSDIMPNREYVDLTDQIPEENEVELPDLPQVPDKRTMVQPTRRVSRKTTLTTSPTTTTEEQRPASSGDQVTGTDDPLSGSTRPLDTTVNSYEDPEAKRPKTEPTWVDELYMEESQPQDTIDIFTAFQETEEFMRVEFDLPAPASNRQRRFLERNPLLYIVKKMKDSEVSLSRLSVKDRALFHRAKMKEVDSFIKNEAVRKCLDDAELRKAMDSGRVVKARWVLTWKLVPPEEQAEALQDSRENTKTVHNANGTKKAKARIVLLGFQHPSLLDPTFKTASPVQSMLGRNLLYTMAADSQWELEGLDLATAFFQTQPTEADQELWTTGVHELREALGIDTNSVMRVLRNIYGSTTAPRGLWLSLHKTLTSLGAQAVLGERCLWIWLSKQKMDGNHPKTIGAMGGHVDDFHRIGDGSPEWLEIRERINNAYKWGMTKTGAYRHAGTDVSTVKDENGYNKTTRATTSRRSPMWTLNLNDSGECNLLLTDLVTNGTMETARDIQQVISEVRQEPFSLSFQKFVKAKHWRDIVFISMGDQAHANRPKGDSTGGLVTLVSGPESVTGRVCPMSLIGWRTWKLKRKAIGSNDAEVQSILEAEDHNFRARLLWSELHGAAGHDSERPLRVDMVDVVERQIAGIKGVLCTDSRGGYDAVELNESPLLGLSNMRAALQAFQLRGNLRRAACELRWLASDFDLADALTKKRADCREGLLKFLRTGYWCIRYDPSFTSAKKGRKVGTTAVGTVQKFLETPHEDLFTDAAAALEMLRGWLRDPRPPFVLKQFAAFFAVWQKEALEEQLRVPVDVDDIVGTHVSELLIVASGPLWEERCLRDQALEVILEHCKVLQPEPRREAFASVLLRLGRSAGTQAVAEAAVALSCRAEATPLAEVLKRGLAAFWARFPEEVFSAIAFLVRTALRIDDASAAEAFVDSAPGVREEADVEAMAEMEEKDDEAEEKAKDEKPKDEEVQEEEEPDVSAFRPGDSAGASSSDHGEQMELLAQESPAQNRDSSVRDDDDGDDGVDDHDHDHGDACHSLCSGRAVVYDWIVMLLSEHSAMAFYQ
ncbi:GIP [Symbiodinium sp. CCMP2456]|nr:GIP [Symbiodinium sp. CCMP2456]